MTCAVPYCRNDPGELECKTCGETYCDAHLIYGVCGPCRNELAADAQADHGDSDRKYGELVGELTQERE